MAKGLEGVSALEAKLDMLIRLQATAMVDRYPAQKDKISFLSKAGMTPTTIADILGTTSNTVNVALSKMRKAKGSKDEGQR